jgi:hypothetical protein
MAYRRGDNDRPEVLGHGFIEATTWGEGMSGDHNMYQKPRSYLDDFECPRCGHCCKTDLAKVGEVGVWGEVQPIYKIEGVGEYGLDLEHSPGVGPYHVRLYDGRYDVSGFDTEQEAREELEYVAGLPRKNT